MKESLGTQLRAHAERMPLDRPDDYVESVWRSGRGRRWRGQAMIAGFAVVAVTIVAVGIIRVVPWSATTSKLAAQTSTSNVSTPTRPSESPSIDQAPTPPTTAELQVLQTWVTYEMGLKAASWPQRPVTIGSDAILVPYGPKDPPDYKAWVNSLTQRYGFRVTQVYVADVPGAPTVEQLEAAKADVVKSLSALPASHRPPVTVGNYYMDGVVDLTYEKSVDPVFLDFLANMQQKYGALLRTQQVESVGGFLSSTDPAPNR